MLHRTSSKTRQEHLASVPLFSSCTAKEFDTIAKLTEELAVSAGEILVRQGTTGYECYVISSGSVCVEINGVLVTTLSAGDHFGELAPIDRQPRSATVTALTDCTLIVLGPVEFATAIATLPGLTMKLLAGLSTRIRSGNAAYVAA